MKTMSLHAAAALTVAAMTIVGLAPPATAASTAIDLTGATATGTVVEVTGTLVLGDDALGEVEVATDGTGDVYVPQAGLDVGNATVRTDVAQKQLVFKLRVNDGNMATDGIAPAFGYGWELVVDGDSTPNYWLAAGHAGSNSPPRTGKWWTLCTTPDGWICSSDIPGTMSRTETTWTLPFDMAKVQFGSVIEPGNGYAGAPGSFP